MIFDLKKHGPMCIGMASFRLGEHPRQPRILELFRHARVKTYNLDDWPDWGLALLVRQDQWNDLKVWEVLAVREAWEAIVSLYGIPQQRIDTYSESEGRKWEEAGDKAGDEVAGVNNCFFATESIIEYDGLKFRSPPEVSIYAELKKRKLLFFPNPAAVLGGENSTKREPDFLICHKGKWGILEVMGEKYPAL